MPRRNFALGFTIAVVLMTACSSPKPPESKAEAEAKACKEPENPYSQGTGHYAGYEWAEKKGSGSCDGSSQSFNEGCEEYENQDAEYEECEANNKK
jgi:hypothetical protein